MERVYISTYQNVSTANVIVPNLTRTKRTLNTINTELATSTLSAKYMSLARWNTHSTAQCNTSKQIATRFKLKIEIIDINIALDEREIKLTTRQPPS